MVAKLAHHQRSGCPVACALDIVGDHWTLLIIRNLMFIGAREYKDMLALDEQISSSVLTTRLKKLEAAGLVGSISHPDSQRRKLYYLLPPGKDLVHVLAHLVYWSDKHLGNQLRIPPEKRQLLEKGPEAFIRAILASLEQWERENLPAPE